MQEVVSHTVVGN